MIGYTGIEDCWDTKAAGLNRHTGCFAIAGSDYCTAEAVSFAPVPSSQP